MIVSKQIPGNTLEIDMPSSTFGMIRNACILSLCGEKYELKKSWEVNTTKERRKLHVRFLWRLSQWLYEKYKPMQFYRCTMKIRLNSEELKLLQEWNPYLEKEKCQKKKNHGNDLSGVKFQDHKPKTRQRN